MSAPSDSLEHVRLSGKTVRSAVRSLFVLLVMTIFKIFQPYKQRTAFLENG